MLFSSVHFVNDCGGGDAVDLLVVVLVVILIVWLLRGRGRL